MLMNPRELDVLNILWKAERPLIATEIVNAGDGLTQSTVTAVLRKLLRANLVEVVGVAHSGKVLSRTYRPTEESRQAILDGFTDNYRNFSNIIPQSSMCAAILDVNTDSKEAEKEISKLKKILSDYEKRVK